MRHRERSTVLGVSYDNLTRDAAIEQALSYIPSGSKAQVCFVNADCIYQAQHDVEYREILRTASLVLSDGVGLSVATRLLGDAMRENCNGTDLSPLLMAEAARRGYRIYLLGGLPGVAARAAENLRRQIPTIHIVGTDHGYHDGKDAEVISRINESGAEILFVGFGVPRQEKWLREHREQLAPPLCLGVGALLDFLSGRVPRAPRLMRVLRLEWTWRLMVEPRRLFRRYVIHGSRFTASVCLEAYRQRRQRQLPASS